ncbi:hypothetical protein D6C85_09108 [Aureobasidium pullulans]|uniref:Uncharacterized protein n=1 Tax=Aureobasidium pullulans TaxID=5580 RepID=A0A4S8VBU6_AURPU|nr:hypothetical protein D6D24_08748 [Aureobasidium pullulans]THY00723.1 hypothetical protein D6D03_06331 [Aureobasidium pullulans]THZ62992.1 hypothetical protein D6C85_09108 [Aureobasidium pullulans]
MVKAEKRRWSRRERPKRRNERPQQKVKPDGKPQDGICPFPRTLVPFQENGRTGISFQSKFKQESLMVCMNGSNSVVDPGSRDRTQIPHAASNDAIVHIDSNRKEGLQDIVAQSLARQYSWPYEGGSRQPAVSCPDGGGDGGDGDPKSSHEVRVRVGLLNLDAVETMPIALLILVITALYASLSSVWKWRDFEASTIARLAGGDVGGRCWVIMMRLMRGLLRKGLATVVRRQVQSTMSNGQNMEVVAGATDVALNS